MKCFFGIGSCFAKFCPIFAKCSFIILEICDSMLVILLLFGCSNMLIVTDCFFLWFNRLFIPSQVIFILVRLSLNNLEKYCFLLNHIKRDILLWWPFYLASSPLEYNLFFILIDARIPFVIQVLDNCFFLLLDNVLKNACLFKIILYLE